MGRRGGGAAATAAAAAGGAGANATAVIGRAELVLRKSGLALGSGAENMGSSSSSLASVRLERCMVVDTTDLFDRRARLRDGGNAMRPLQCSNSLKAETDSADAAGRERHTSSV
jgi:hypothetical protein